MPMAIAMRFKACFVSLCLLLGACSTLPRIVPHMARATTPVQVDSARGPLSPARGGADTSIFDRHLALEQAVSDSPLLTGNRVRLLQDGPDTYGAMLAAIRAARDVAQSRQITLEQRRHRSVGVRLKERLA